MRTLITYTNKLPTWLLFSIVFMAPVQCISQSPWTPIKDMPRAKEGHSACFLDGKLYVMGGVDYYDYDKGDFVFRELHVYDPILDDWTEKAEMPNRRYNFSSCAYDGKILAIGGSTDIYWTPVSAIDAYDPASDTWNHIADIPKPGVWQAAVLLEDKIYVIGGAATEPEFPYTDSSVQIYDLLTDTWSMGADILTPRAGHSAVVLNGKIYALGGQQGKSYGYLGIDAVEEYDPETDTWIKAASMIFSRKHHESVTLDGKIHVFGGGSGLMGDKLWAGEIYDPYTDAWRELSSAPTQWGLCAASESNGKMFIGGGGIFQSFTEFMYLKCWYIYDPHFDLYPMLDYTFVDKNAVIAGTDSVLISTRMYDPTGITLSAKITTLEGMPRDSIQLYDDGNHNDGSAGDSLFANTWQVNSTEELQYSLCVEVTQMGSDTIVNEFNREVISTKELVTYEGFSYHPDDTVPDPGDNIKISINLKNNSSITTTKIKARLYSLNELAWVLTLFNEFQEMAPGETATTDFFRTLILKNCPRDTVLAFPVDISSYDHLFRTDTIFMSVAADATSYVSDHSSYPVRIYPNPADDLITIEAGQSGPLWIEITSLNGQLLYSTEREGSSHQIDLSSFQKGVYFITIRSADSVTTRKIIKLE